MNTQQICKRDSIIAFCQNVGADPLLVQGAGGNVSWKEGNTLWIKASGTWLAEAAEKDIFVPVDLAHLETALAEGDFGAKPRVLGSSNHRPSIETLLHALMPQPVVVHLHAVEILSHLVRVDCEVAFDTLQSEAMNWVCVPYRKPGAALASAVGEALAISPEANVVFLRNHGVVIGGDDVVAVEKFLNELTSLLAIRPRVEVDVTIPISSLTINESLSYAPVSDTRIQQLAFDEHLFARLSSDWVLYPDHAVFLGAKAAKYSSIANLMEEVRQMEEAPYLVFVQDVGVYAKSQFSPAKLAQLHCYYEVLARQPQQRALCALTYEQIAELLDWDAEKYRQSVSL